MSDNEQKPAKILRTSSGSTRLSAGSGKSDTTGSGSGSTPKAPANGGAGSAQYSMRGGSKPAEADAPQAGAQRTQSAAPTAGGARTSAGTQSKRGDATPRTATVPAVKENAGRSSSRSESAQQGGGAQGGQAPRNQPTAASKQVRLSGSGSSPSAASTTVQPRVDEPAGAPAGSGPATSAPSAPQGSGPAVQRAAGQGSGAQGSGAPVATATAVPPVGSQGSRAAGSDSVRATSAGVKMGSGKKKGPRTVKLTVAKVDPWTVMKMSFLLSVAVGIATVVAALILWLVLQATGTLQNLQSTLGEIAGTESADQLLALFGLGRVLSFAFILAAVNVVLMTALSTVGALLYNIGASIVGGFHLTLTDD